MQKIVLALSGGMDSGVLLAHCLKQFPEVKEIHTVSFNYGSKHNELECQAARNVADHYIQKHQGLDGAFHLVSIEFPPNMSALMDRETPVPEGHYNDENMRQTVVPGRNTVFYAHMLSLAESLGGEVHIMLGIHQGDHHIYPDCRPGWLYAADELAKKSSLEKVRVFAPFLEMTKAEIVRYGLDLKFPFQLTRTCYTDNEIACGKCGSCTERLEAFLKNNAVDPIPYQGGCPNPFCGRMHQIGDSRIPVLTRDVPKNIDNLPKAHDIAERFARIMKNAAENGVHPKTEVGNELLNRMNDIARHSFKYDLLKDVPIS